METIVTFTRAEIQVNESIHSYNCQWFFKDFLDKERKTIQRQENIFCRALSEQLVVVSSSTSSNDLN